MAKNIYEIPNVVTTMVDGTLIYGATPGGVNPDPFTDAVITKVNFFLPLQSQITTNAANITTGAARITVLENALTKTNYDDVITDFNITQNADSRIINIGFRSISGTPVIRVYVGDTEEEEYDLVELSTITGSELSADLSEYTLTDRTVYIVVSGGLVDIVIFSRENLYQV